VAERIDADACVVGAGFAGLTAALRLHQGGQSVVVLEARDRIGGRVWTQALPDGSPVDRGGAWLAPDHDAIFGLAREFGVATYKTWVKGSHLLVEGDRVRRYTGLIPKISPFAVLSIALAQARLDWTSRRISLDAPWTARRAPEWDSQTVAWWLAHAGIRTPVARDLFDMAVRGLFTGALEETSFLNLLFLVRAHGSINKLFSIKGGAQENMVEGGVGTIAQRIVEALGGAVRLNTPVRSIRQREDSVLVEVAFEPDLPDDRRMLYTKAVAGPEAKTLVVYPDPFWRADGFSGQSAGPGSVAEVTLDATPASGRPGVIASFTFGTVAERVTALDGVDRHRAVVEALTARFGPKAASPDEFIETTWWTDQWTRGCSMAHFPPGILTGYGHLLRQPFGLVHWAGTETSTKSHGAIDGAVLSGERTATEILARA
jgi:monoamine oxidase